MKRIFIALVAIILFAGCRKDDDVAVVPNAPTELAGTLTGLRVDLNWKDNSDNETGFRVERNTDSTGYVYINTLGPNITSYTDTTVRASHVYDYRVTAYTIAGESRSNVVNLNTFPPPCTENSIVLNDLLGDYANTNEDLGGSPYGPYTATVSNAVSTGATSATIDVENIFDTGWGAITFTLDWSDPANPTAIVVPGDVPNSDYGSDFTGVPSGTAVAVRVPPTSVSAVPGSYTYCGMTFRLLMQVGESGGAWIPDLYEVNLAR